MPVEERPWDRGILAVNGLVALGVVLAFGLGLVDRARGDCPRGGQPVLEYVIACAMSLCAVGPYVLWGALAVRERRRGVSVLHRRGAVVTVILLGSVYVLPLLLECAVAGQVVLGQSTDPTGCMTSGG